MLAIKHLHSPVSRVADLHDKDGGVELGGCVEVVRTDADATTVGYQVTERVVVGRGKLERSQYLVHGILKKYNR